MRRHAHSCDQCRRSKRACDAPQLTLPAGVEADRAALLSGNLQPPETPPCSYCKKTSKTCTMNWAWNQLQLSNVLDAASRRNIDELDSQIPMKRAQPSESTDVSDTSSQSQYGDHTGSTPVAGAGVMPNFPFQTSLPQQTAGMMPTSQGADPSIFPGHLPGPMPDGLFNLQGNFGNMHEDAGAQHLGMPDLGFGFPENVPHSTSLGPSMPFSFPSTISPPSTGVLSTPYDPSASDFSYPLPGHNSELLNTPMESAGGNSTAHSRRSDSHSDSQPDRKRRRFTDDMTALVSRPSMSAFNVDQQMMKLHTRSMFSESLIRVYHDVLEHNLSCWATEATCPYSGALCRAEGRQSAEWGTSWTNRILDRTMKLEASTKATGLVKLTRAQDQAASRAVQMAIMAFATQWAQGSSRQNEKYASTRTSQSGKAILENATSEFADSLDRLAQQHFWHEAQKALNEVADVESYSVICAEVIMGFTQKPWMPEDSETGAAETQNGQKSDAFDMDALMSEITRCIEKDGPPVFLERAARKAHALKFRATAAAKGIAKRQGLPKRLAKNQVLSPEDEKTAGLLYWLAVMADTISSSMNERPITVNDEDSQHDLVTDEDREGGRWKIDLFIKDDLDNPTMLFSWPCTHEEAAEGVTIASPVKILMYRHVSYLQGMLRRGQSGKRLEDVVRSATRLWEYWNKTHGRFFRQLVDDNTNVPVRIRGWFFCISAHWHLAMLLLIELLEFVDEEGLGSEEGSRSRESSRLLARMKESSMRELSDLGHMSLPPSETNQPPTSMLADADLQPELHHAISEATILSEPWTIILIRAFSKVGGLLLKEVDNAQRIGRPPMFAESEALRRAEDCIKTLFYLGKKSDMARRVADMLSEAMDALETWSHAGSPGDVGDLRGDLFGNMQSNMNGQKPINRNGHGYGNTYGNGNRNGNASGNGNGANFGAFNSRDFMGMAMPTA